VEGAQFLMSCRQEVFIRIGRAGSEMVLDSSLIESASQLGGVVGWFKDGPTAKHGTCSTCDFHADTLDSLCRRNFVLSDKVQTTVRHRWLPHVTDRRRCAA
jgi:hypothetical protein